MYGVLRHTCRGGLRSQVTLVETLRRLPALQCRSSSKLEPAAPGTVKGYDQHLFIDSSGHTHEDWPSSVEKTPAVLQAFGALAKLKEQITGTVKITAYSSPGNSDETADNTCNALLFPAGLGFYNLRPGDLDAVVRNHMTDSLPEARSNHAGAVQELQGLHLFVCCHGARDGRCGHCGPPLARRLRTLVRERGLTEHLHVYECSHVGGHKYAGNVLVFGAISPNDGDWYGGVQAGDADGFLTALTEIEFGTEGGFDHPVLRQWWRGRMGLSKDQQKVAFEQGSLAGSDDSDFGDEDSDAEVEAAVDARGYRQ